MKHLYFFLAFVMLGTFSASAQAVMTFEATTIDYGIIDKGAEPVRKFVFTNTGNAPLVITHAQGSCGCTVPTYPKEPIMPGQKSSIDVRYDTNRVGGFSKTVTLTTNETEPSRMLTIKGEVKDVPATNTITPAKQE